MMKWRLGMFLRWVRGWYRDWSIEQVPMPPKPPPSRPIEPPIPRARMVAISAPSRRPKGQSSVQRHALKRRAHLHALRNK